MNSSGAVVGLMTRINLSAMDDGRLLADPVGAEPMILEEIRPWVWREVGGQAVVWAYRTGVVAPGGP